MLCFSQLEPAIISTYIVKILGKYDWCVNSREDERANYAQTAAPESDSIEEKRKMNMSCPPADKSCFGLS